MNNPEAPKGEENIYGYEPWIGDYFNETFAVGIDGNGKIYRKSLMKTVEERYASMPDKGEEKEEMIRIPEKIKRINQIANILNTTEDVTIFKQAMNELGRLIFREDREYLFLEPQFNPDLLKP